MYPDRTGHGDYILTGLYDGQPLPQCALSNTGLLPHNKGQAPLLSLNKGVRTHTDPQYQSARHDIMQMGASPSTTINESTQHNTIQRNATQQNTTQHNKL